MRSRSEPESASWRVEHAEGEVRLSGVLRTAEATPILAAIREASAGMQTIALDLAGVEQIDTGVVTLLLDETTSRGARVNLKNGDRFRPLFEMCMEGCAWQFKRKRPAGLVEQVGLGALREVHELDQVLQFIGEMTLAAGRLLKRPQLGHWGEIPLLVERAGMDALPVVLVLNFLVGFVTAFMSARALSMFGANIFVADLVSISMTRQLAPLLTAIIICGRSGAAFAAELGSMKVAEEIDALRTLGLEPFGWLVMPRVLALVLVTPILTLLADLVGMLGGMSVAVMSLGLTSKAYFNETRAGLVAWDIESGLWMSIAFAYAIGFIACQQGLSASGGAEGVGRRTTKTVVISLFAIILLDAIFTVIYRTLGLS